MKKLFALVLALAMALAIAIPTMAAGWDPIVPETKPATAISFKLYGLETKENTAVLGSLYQELTATYPLVKGTEVHFMAVVDIPAEAKLSDANNALIEARGLTLTISTDYIKITKATRYLDSAAGNDVTSALNADKNEYTVVLDKTFRGSTIKFEFVGEGTTAGKDATVKASLGYYNAWDADTFKAYNADGDLAFTVTAKDVDKDTAGTFTVSDGKNSIVFPVIKKAIDPTTVITMTVAAGKNNAAGTFEVNRNVASELTFKDDADKVWGPTDTTGQYTALKAIFDNFFAMLGFEYAGANAMTKAHFVKYFGTIDEVVNTLVYPAGYVTVTNPTVEPPQTGDATTVVGFVMIALALVAAAVVTVKKVRA